MRRASISLKPSRVMHVNRVAANKRLVYAILTDKKFHYPKGRSRVGYIGTTKTGFRRVAQSAASKADAIFSLPGVREFEVRIVTCTGRQRVKMWRKLERAMLLEFRSIYGEVPKGNSHGKRMKEIDEFGYFSRSKVQQVLRDIA
jgi:hypothetical protein